VRSDVLAASAVIGLQKAVFSQEQIEVLAGFADAQLDISRLATKADLTETEAELIKWMFGIAAGQLGFLLAALKLFPGGGP
jgi:hypothetical protein